MRLADFILANIEPILGDWESFAREIWPGATADPAALRDHAEDILRGTARDMQTAQTLGEQHEKSLGHGAANSASGAVGSASTVHAAGRLRSGFDMMLLISEYRALRASVLRLWREALLAPNVNDIDDITRFNESIDQSLAIAVNRYSADVDHSREMFLAILGHDLRNPLNAVTLIANVITLQKKVDAPTLEMIGQIKSSGVAMSRIINDLLDFASTRLGCAMPVSRGRTDLNHVCQEVIREMRAGHPGRAIHLNGANVPENHVPIEGDWDAQRLRQLISNLLGNAIQHGDAAAPITVMLRDEASDAVLAVHNEGSPIRADQLATIFNPLVRDVNADATTRRRDGSIGLGLYIAREVVTAHAGTIAVTSTADAGTTFTVRLPRKTASRTA